LRKEHRLRISENGVLRKIFGLIWEDVTGKRRDFTTRRIRICTKLYWENEIIHKQMGGAHGTYWEDEKCIQVFGEATRGKETRWKT
jgi:hypothetical protein